jgi:hypothetical protein
MQLSGQASILVSYFWHMLNRRTIWLLAAVMALGTACVVPGACAQRGAEVCAIASRAEQHCEQKQMGRKPQAHAEGAPAQVSLNYQPPQAPRFEWPASYQRPPTQNL